MSAWNQLKSLAFLCFIFSSSPMAFAQIIPDMKCITDADCNPLARSLNNTCSLNGQCISQEQCAETLEKFDDRTQRISDARYSHWFLGLFLPFISSAIVGNNLAKWIGAGATVWEALTIATTYKAYKSIHYYRVSPVLTERLKRAECAKAGCWGAVSAVFILGHLVTYLATGLGYEYFLEFRDVEGEKGGKPDLVVLAQQGAETIRINLRTFDEAHCAAVEKCIGGLGERRLLRFSTYIANIGNRAFVTTMEGKDSEFSECHGHWHAMDASHYWLAPHYDVQHKNKTIIEEVRKQGYCFRDDKCFLPHCEYGQKYQCGVFDHLNSRLHGITPGWYDNYHNDLDCQWIDITNVAPGTYYLGNDINPTGIYCQDSNQRNNRAVYKIVIPPVNHTVERSNEGLRVPAQIVVDYTDESHRTLDGVLVNGTVVEDLH